MTLKAIKEELCKEVDEMKDDLMEVSNKIHSEPELGFAEYKAVEGLCQLLRREKFQVDQGIGNLETAFRARLCNSTESPVIAFLAEYDALPELGHACGHNLIGTASVGAALAFSKLNQHIPGTIEVIGTPSEESTGGKIELLKEGAFEDVDVSLMFHPSNSTIVHCRSLALKKITAEFIGKAAHASFSPEEGVNALEAVILTFNGINSIRQSLEQNCQIHGVITKGGVKPNIIPEIAEAEITVRAPTVSLRDKLVEDVKAIAQSMAKAIGTELNLTTSRGYKGLNSNKPLADAFEENLHCLDVPIDGIESDFVASTDMGDVSKEIPSIHPFISINTDAALHTEEFEEKSGTESANQVMITATKALAMTGADILYDEALLSKIQKYFRKN